MIARPLINPIWQYLISLSKRPRDARYTVLLLVGLFVFLFMCLQALNTGLFDSVERPLFDTVNSWPAALYPLFFAATQFGGMGSLPLWFAGGWAAVNRRAAITAVGAGALGWFAAKFVKDLIQRGRPGSLIEDIQLWGEQLGGYGFPSGHATTSAAIATVLYFQMQPKYRKYLLSIVLLVGLSRMYLGAHFPFDIVGGWALGAIIGALITLVFGISKENLSSQTIKRVLKKRGLDIRSLQFAHVDARGSRPIFITLKDGTKYFGKIFGSNEHAADWLFKIYRFFRYKNLTAEEPYVNARRNVEMEAFATLWARQGGVRTARIIDTHRIGKSWVLIQEMIDGAEPMDKKTRIKQSALEDVWQQVSIMHEANLAHRDLRSANIMIDRKSQAWIIDFGFAEVSPSIQRKRMDIAELLMSMSLVVGVKRTLNAAYLSFDAAHIASTLPYLQTAVFSGETAKQIKANKDILRELRESIKKPVELKDDLEDAKIIRLNRKKLLNFVLLSLFVYAIIPQFTAFKGVFEQLQKIEVLWLIPLTVASVSTYLMTGLIYVILSNIPLRYWRTALTQLAASFVSKIIPGGVGSSAVNLRYLTRSGLDNAEAGAVIAAQGVIGFIMFIVPMLIFFTLTGGNVFKAMHFSVPAHTLVIVGILVVSFLTAVVLIKPLRQKALEAVLKFAANIRDISTSPRELALTAAASLGVTVVYIAALYFSFKAVGAPLGLLAAITVYATATIAKTAVPTPGGLGPLEAAMAATIISFGLDKPLALSIVILYRLATFWLPIPFSILSYRYIEKKRYI